MHQVIRLFPVSYSNTGVCIGTSGLMRRLGLFFLLTCKLITFYCKWGKIDCVSVLLLSSQRVHAAELDHLRFTLKLRMRLFDKTTLREQVRPNRRETNDVLGGVYF